MASFTAGTTFSDGVANDVTAAKLGALITEATPTSGFIQDRTLETITATNDTLLIGDASDSNNLKRITVANFAQTLPTAKITTGTIDTGTFGTTTSTAGSVTTGTIVTGTFGTTTSTAATITTGTIPTLVATTLVTTGTGTAAAPAIVPTGDTNTGLFFPAADTLAATTQGTERIRIDSSGNVEVKTAGAKIKLARASDASLVGEIGSQSGTGISIKNIGGTTSEAVIGGDWFAVNTNNTERLRVDSSGNVGIGTSNPTTKLAVDGGSAAQYGKFNSNAANGGYLTFESSGTVHGDIGTAAQVVSGGSASDFGINARGARNLILGTNNTERLRIDSSGNVLLGGSTGSERLSILSGSTYHISFKNTSSSSIGAIGYDATDNLYFYGNGGLRMYITSGGEVRIAGTTDQGAYNLQVNGTGVWGAGAYFNGSDSRIKEDIQPLASCLDVIEKLNPVTYRYKQSWSSDQSIQSGFIAQELLTALDGQNYVDGIVQQGGAEGYYSVSYQNLIAVLTKAIQELKAENDLLKSRVAALEAA